MNKWTKMSEAIGEEVLTPIIGAEKAKVFSRGIGTTVSNKTADPVEVEKRLREFWLFLSQDEDYIRLIKKLSSFN